MGGGFYSTARSTVTAKSYSGQSRHEVFNQRTINSEMDPENVSLRESCDSEEHPNSLPIIIALDVTGSMGHIPDSLVRGGLTKIMGNIIQNGIDDPQVLFVAIGDHQTDRCPLQVGQFESSDELLDKWLTSVYLEGNGGGNAGESYHLAWYFASRYVKTDHWNKRKQKGLLFTIGDEPVLENFPASDQRSIMGNDNGEFTNLTTQDILKDVSNQWDVYHINVAETFKGSKSHTQDSWKQLLGENCIVVDHHQDVPATIARKIAESQDIQNFEFKSDDELVKNDVEETDDKQSDEEVDHWNLS